MTEQEIKANYVILSEEEMKSMDKTELSLVTNNIFILTQKVNTMAMTLDKIGQVLVAMTNNLAAYLQLQKDANTLNMFKTKIKN